MFHEMAYAAYFPTLTEIAITLAFFAGMFLLYALFTRIFPIIPLWETADEPLGEVEPEPTVSQAQV
jgi:Ni/Fe-hydrogenase subunit HybB-like protein